MFLSRLHLNTRSRTVRRDVSDCHQLHRTVMGAFPDLVGGRAGAAVLFRLETERMPPVLYVQSAAPPDWAALPEDYLHQDWMGEANPAVKSVVTAWRGLQRDQHLRFRLLANVVQRLRVPGGGTGPRVPVSDPEQQLAWLAKKGEQGGFSLLATPEDDGVPAVCAVKDGARNGWKGKEGDKTRLSFAGVLFDGRLEVTDPDAFRRTLRDGIGPAKAYGYGLLSIAP